MDVVAAGTLLGARPCYPQAWRGHKTTTTAVPLHSLTHPTAVDERCSSLGIPNVVCCRKTWIFKCPTYQVYTVQLDARLCSFDRNTRATLDPVNMQQLKSLHDAWDHPMPISRVIMDRQINHVDASGARRNDGQTSTMLGGVQTHVLDWHVVDPGLRKSQAR